MEWSKFYNKETITGRPPPPPINPKWVARKTFTLMQGAPLFFAYTTSSPTNATIVAHCQKEIINPNTNLPVVEKAVWLLSKQDTGGVLDSTWEKVADSDPTVRWMNPACHNAGGGDSVLIVEDGWLVSRSLSRWKRGADYKPIHKKLMPVRGQIHFVVAPDSSRAVVLQEDVSSGFHSLTVIDGESALDPCSEDRGKQYELPFNKLAIAFWFSPDSTKILCLTVAGYTKKDLAAQKGNFRVGLNTEMQNVVYNFPLQEVREYDVYKPTPYFMKTYVPFFSTYTQVYNPWAPDSNSFIYCSSSGLTHCPLVPGRVSLGYDKWMNQGASFGT
eukprot:gene2098-2499_t